MVKTIGEMNREIHSDDEVDGIQGLASKSWSGRVADCELICRILMVLFTSSEPIGSAHSS